jgi:hypothetical protein
MKNNDDNNRNDGFLIDQSIHNEYGKTDYEEIKNSQVLIDCAISTQPKSNKNQMVNKMYEIHQNSISESYFNIADKEEAKDFFNDYAHNLNDGLILVINNEEGINEIQYFTSVIQSCITLVIGYGTINHAFKDANLANIKQIITNSIESAISEAYIRAKNGQTILFAHVNSNFDLFEHIGMVC